MKDCDLLKDVCDFQNGFAFKSKTFKSEGIPLIRISDIQNQQTILDNAVYIQEKDYNKDLSSFKVYNDDILIAMSGGTTGKIGIHNSNQICLLNQRVGLFRPKNNLNKKYLYYFLITKVEENLRIAEGSAQPNLSSEQIKSMLIPRLTLFEQEKIVEKLDTCIEQIDKAIQNVEQNIHNAEELFQSYLNKIFSQKNNQWVNSEFGKIYDVRDGTHDSPKYQSEGYPLVTSKNLKNGKIILNKIKYISFNDYSNINKRSRVDVGDVLFAMIGTIGNPVVIIEEPNFAIKNVALFKVPNTQNSHFLKYFLDSNIVRNKMQVDAKGSTQRFVGLGYLRSFRIDIPSKEIQDHLVSRINVFKSQNDLVFSNYKLELQSLNEFKQSILEKAFNGEL